MKKVLIIVVLLGMLSGAIYEFVFPLNDSESELGLNDREVDRELEEDPFEIAVDQELENNDQTNIKEESVGLEVGQLAPDFELTRLTGEKVSLSDYRGRSVMLNFWATWCPPCRVEMPDMEQFYRDTDVEILAINLTETEQHVDRVYQFAEDYELSFPILLDEFIDVASTYEIQPIPTSLMVDRDGIIQFKTFGPLTYEQMMQVLEDIN